MNSNIKQSAVATEAETYGAVSVLEAIREGNFDVLPGFEPQPGSRTVVDQKSALTDGNKRKDRVKVTCLECGTEHFWLPCFSNRKFCNRACACRYNNRARQKREVKDCPICSNSFESLVCHDQKYCSRQCADAGRKKVVPLNCEHCGERYERHCQKYAQSRFCSNKCKLESGALSRADREMSQEDYDMLLELQDYKCAICQKPETSLFRRGEDRVVKLAKDHDHETGKWRGLLCRRCNVAIGLLGDNSETVLRAAEYIANGGVLDAEYEALCRDS